MMDQKIYAYNNYREFIEDYFTAAKNKNKSFSYRAFCKAVGFTSPNFLRLIVLGQRNLSAKAIKKLIKYFKFNSKEADFFENLVLFNQSESYEDKSLYFERICFFKAYQEVKRLDFAFYQYFSKWYIPTIREMTLFENFREDPKWIVARLAHSISEAEAKQALKVLINLGLLKYDSQKRLRTADKNLSTDNEVAHISLLTFHKKMIELGGLSLETTPSAFRDVSSITIALDYKGFKKAKKKLQDLRQELNLELSKVKSVEAVYQINFQLFNLTKIPKKWVG